MTRRRPFRDCWLRLRLLRRGSGRLRLLPTKRFQVTDELPALWFGQLRPHRHSFSNHAIRQDPENRARRGALHFRDAEVWPFLAALRRITVTLGAVLLEENSACGNGVRILLQRICALARFFRRLLQLRVDGRIVLTRRPRG